MYRYARQVFCRRRGIKCSRLCSSTATNSSVTNSSSPATAQKDTLLNRWKRFWTILYSDYKDVAVDTIKTSKSKPRKTAFYISGIGFVLYAFETNPEGRHFYEAMVKSANDTILVSDANLNPTADTHLCFLRKSYNEGTIRCLNLGLFSLMWLNNFHSDCGIYPSQCDYLKPSVMDFHKRVVDIGFLGHWWNIQRYMKDFDINPKEFPNQ